MKKRDYNSQLCLLVFQIDFMASYQLNFYDYQGPNFA